MEGTEHPLTAHPALAEYRPGQGVRRQRRLLRMLGPGLATALLLIASYALALHLSLAFWAILPVAAVALIVTGLLGSLMDAPSGRFHRRLSVYARAVAWMWRALVVYAAGLVLFLATIWLFG